MFDAADTFARMLHHRARTLAPGDSLAPPIVPASMYFLPGQPDAPHQYGRWTNPTWTALEEALAILEDARVVTFPSGMAAIASIFCTQLKTGDRLLLPADGYYTTRLFADKYLASSGVSVDVCPTAEYGSCPLEGYRVVLVETPANPGLDVCDIRAITRTARIAGALVVCDNTTMTPLGQRPLDLGADVVVASDTKALNGHSDVLFGHVATRDEAIAAAAAEWRKLAGAVPGQFEAWLVYRGLETLEVRFERMCATAAAAAERLSAHPAVRQVRYPGLSSHPAHDVARGQMHRFGSVLGVTFADAGAAERFIGAAQFVVPSTSFGSVHTSAERRARWGDRVEEGYVRLSIGCEPTEALWSDIARALETV